MPNTEWTEAPVRSRRLLRHECSACCLKSCMLTKFHKSQSQRIHSEAVQAIQTNPFGDLSQQLQNVRCFKRHSSILLMSAPGLPEKNFLSAKGFVYKKQKIRCLFLSRMSQIDRRRYSRFLEYSAIGRFWVLHLPLVEETRSMDSCVIFRSSLPSYYGCMGGADRRNSRLDPRQYFRVRIRQTSCKQDGPRAAR